MKFIACLVTLTYVHSWHRSHRLQLDESSLLECVSFRFCDAVPVRSACRLDAVGFPVLNMNVTSRKLASARSVKYQSAFLHINREDVSTDLFGPLQYLAGISREFSIILNRDEGLRVSYAQPTADSTTKQVDPFDPMIGTREWWTLILNSTGVRFSHTVWNFDKSQLMIKTVVGVSPAKCRCSKFVNHDVQFQRRYRDCAVVMNSGLMRNLRHLRTGEAIDLHEAVFRLNAGPSGGFYAPIVGSKTTFRLIYPTETTLQSIGDETTLYSIYYSRERRLLKRAIRANRFPLHAKLAELRKSFRNCAKHCIELPERHTSTGILAVVLALTMCDRITVFGKSLQFDSFNTSQFSYHYFEDDISSDIDDMFSTFHRPDLEYNFFREVAQLGVTFVP